MKLLIVFVILSIINVVFSTIRSIATVNGGKLSASLLNGGYFAFYNIMLLYTVMDFPMWQKCLITFACNVVGVYIVKLFEEKARKDKMWLVKITIPIENANLAKQELNSYNISYTYYNLTKYFVIDSFCETKNQTSQVLEICKKYNGKAFGTENKLFL